jgi:teichuronic acid biosynthesis glycosyltransferase TuaG
MPNPTFTIVTPVLNGRDHLGMYIFSLLKQTCEDWEAIIVDDGSTDGTINALKCLTTDPRFRVVENTLPKSISSPYQARNVGLRLARGNFVCFLDIDDRWLPNNLMNHLYQFKQRPELTLHFTSYIRAPYGDIKKALVRHPLPLFTPKQWSAVANPIPMLASCIRRSALSDIKFRPLYHEDYIFWYQVIGRLHVRQILCTLEPFSIYSVNPKSLSGDKKQSILWLWRCYRSFGYSIALATVAIALRAVTQLYILVSDRLYKY